MAQETKTKGLETVSEVVLGCSLAALLLPLYRCLSWQRSGSAVRLESRLACSAERCPSDSSLGLF